MIANVIQMYTDKIVPKRTERWGVAILLFLIFILRILIKQTHFLVTYIVMLYILHGLINFLTPKDAEYPDIFDDFEKDFELPANIDNEFRPFIRRLPEFQFWSFFMKHVCGALFTTFFEIFDISVYVPILVMYFILIAALTAKNLSRHMKKYGYNPFFSEKKIFKIVE